MKEQPQEEVRNWPCPSPPCSMFPWVHADSEQCRCGTINRLHHGIGYHGSTPGPMVCRGCGLRTVFKSACTYEPQPAPPPPPLRKRLWRWAQESWWCLLDAVRGDGGEW